MPSEYLRKRRPLRAGPAKTPQMWERLGTATSFLSSVVLASVALVINCRVQQQQDDNAKWLATIQQQTQAAQLAATRAAQFSEHQLQESKFTADLLQSILDRNPSRRILTISVLRHSVSQSLYEDVLGFVANGDTDPKVRVFALKLLGRENNPALTTFLGHVALDAAKPITERREAVASISAIGLGSISRKCEQEISNATQCHKQYPAGCSTGGHYDTYVNYLKNRVIEPQATARVLTAAELSRLDRSIPSTLTRDNRALFIQTLTTLGEGSIVELTGYLYAASAMGATSANCQLKSPSDRSWGLRVGSRPELAAQIANNPQADQTELRKDTIIAEITPHTRSAFHPGWSLELLRSLIGKRIRLRGQLILNTLHLDPRDVCSMAGADLAHCWRRSAWEVHPVAELFVCQSDGDCPDVSAGWQPLEGPTTTSN